MVKKIFSKIKNRVKKAIGIMGPGFVTGASDDDPSGIGTYSIAGAKYGLLMAWLVPFQLPLMFVIQEMCARIGLVTGKGLAANMKKFFPKPILYFAIIILFVANTFNIAADISIMANSVKMLVGFDVNFWAILITLSIILMEIYISYHFYSKILIWLAFFLCAYIITAFITVADWGQVIKFTFIPHIKFDKDFLIIATGFIGTTISPYLFFWQTSQEIEEIIDNKESTSKKSIKNLMKKIRLDTFLGMVFSQIISLFIVITCFSTLYKNGLTDITSAHDAAMALRPLAGDWAYLIFTIGIIGAGFLGIPVLAGSVAYALSEVFGYKQGLRYKFGQAKFFYGVIAFSTIIGLLINFIGMNPMKALLYAAVVNAITSVPLIAFIIILANKTEVMGEHKNKFFANFFGYITFALMLLTAVVVFI